jgi:hypothetical protein
MCNKIFWFNNEDPDHCLFIIKQYEGFLNNTFIKSNITNIIRKIYKIKNDQLVTIDKIKFLNIDIYLKTKYDTLNGIPNNFKLLSKKGYENKNISECYKIIQTKFIYDKLNYFLLNNNLNNIQNKEEKKE